MPNAAAPSFETTFTNACLATKTEYAQWYAEHALACETGRTRINAPGEYDDGELTILGEQIFEAEYQDKSEYFDETVRLYLEALKTAKCSGADYPDEIAMDAIADRDPDMDLAGALCTISESLKEVEVLLKAA